jgi:hypothetical protein
VQFHDGSEQDTWFWNLWPDAGSYIFVVALPIGYGPHHNRDTLYLKPEQIIGVVDPATYRRVAKHYNRLARTSATAAQ